MRTRLTAGEKPIRKRMATLACVYDADPARRRPHDVIAPPGGRHGHRSPRPRARAKWLTGSVEYDPAEVIAAADGLTVGQRVGADACVRYLDGQAGVPAL